MKIDEKRSRSAGGTGRKKAPASSAGRDLASVIDFVLDGVPEAEVQMKFGNASFSVGKKVFCFTRPEGMVMKLPAETIDGLVEEGRARRLVMGKRVMKEWAVVECCEPKGYRRDVELLLQAMRFVTLQA